MSETGRLHSVQTMGTLDGPGVRFVAFLQGCPLRCCYCHNPDTWEVSAGEQVTARELAKRALRYRPYFGPEGGVTLSGGEPLMQAGFVKRFFEYCKAEGLHTALDTSGCLLNEEVQQALAVTDLVLLDIKMTTEEAYRRQTGGSLTATLDFLRYCQEREIPLWVRHVVVPGLNDTGEDVRRLTSLLKEYSVVKKVELLPFRKLCLEKYRRMGLRFPLEEVPECSPERCQELWESAGLP